MKTIIFSALFAKLMLNAAFGQTIPATVFPVFPGVNNSNVSYTDVGFDGGQRLWVASGNYGVFVYDSMANGWNTLNTASGLLSDSVNCLAFQGNNVWIGTNNGVVLYSGAPGQGGVIISTYLTPQLPSAVVTALLVESGAVWFGTFNGVARLNLPSGNWDYFTLGNDSITKIIRDGIGRVWVGTRNGLEMTQDNGLTWTTFNAANTGNAISPFIFDIEFDVSGRVWVSSATSNTLYGPICSVSYLWSGTWKIFNMQDFEYGFISGAVSARSLNFAKNQAGELLFTDSAPQLYYGKILNPGQCSLNYFNVQDFASFTCNGVNVTGFILEVMPDGQLFRLGRVRQCGVAFAYDGILKSITSLTILPVPTSNSCDGCGAEPPQGKSELDINLVNTTILSGGDMHWDLNEARYEVPKGSGLNTIFASSHWIGGIDPGGQIRAAAQTYRQTGVDFWAGPIDGLSIPAGDSTSKYFDRVFKISRWEIEAFKNHFQAGTVSYQPCNNNVPLGIIIWPAKGNGPITGDLAPFVDVDGNGIYNPLTGGDYPQIKGDQMLFKVYNDSLNTHTETFPGALGFEFRTSVYAYLCNNIPVTDKVLNYTTLYSTQIINKSNRDYTDVCVGVWSDVDLGDYLDDYIQCDIGRNAGFVFNGDNNDGTSSGYGTNPPIMNIKILKGPKAPPGDGKDNNNNGIIDELDETFGMNSFMTYGGFPINDNPYHDIHYYGYMKSRFLNDSAVTYGGYGYNINSTDTAYFLYPGDTDPVYFPQLGPWTETTTGNMPGDRVLIVGVGPFDLNAGDTAVVDFAYIFSRDSLSGGNMNFALNNANLDLVQSWFNNDNFPGCVIYSTGIDDEIKNDFSVYPNPTSGVFHIAESPVDLAGSHYEIFNLVGEKVQDGDMNLNTIDITGLPSQIYIIKVFGRSSVYFSRIVKL